MATVGQDFAPDREYFEGLEISLDHVKEIPELFTPQAFITTDHDNNQITAFQPGAMMRSYENHVRDVPGVSIGIVSPDGYEGMLQDAKEFAERSEEHKSELLSLMRISYAVFCLKTKKHSETK